jgi:hypothetical protein
MLSSPVGEFVSELQTSKSWRDLWNTLYNLTQDLKKHYIYIYIYICIFEYPTEADVMAVSETFQMGIIHLKHTNKNFLNKSVPEFDQFYLFKDNFPRVYNQPLNLHHCDYSHEFSTLKDSKPKLKSRHDTHMQRKLTIMVSNLQLFSMLIKWSINYKYH